MNTIKYQGCDVVNFKRIKGSRADIALRNTLDYVAGLVERTYHTPDDMTFQFRMDATLNNSIGPNIKVLCTFIPRQVIKDNKNMPHLGNRKPKFCMELYYKTDVEMTEHIYHDIIKILNHYGKSALYNRSGQQIVCLKDHEEKKELGKPAVIGQPAVLPKPLDFSNMFSKCNSLTSLDLSKLIEK